MADAALGELARLREEAEDLRRQVERQRDEIADLTRERGRLVAQVLDTEEEIRRRVAEVLHDDALQSLLAAHQELIEAAPGRAQVKRAHDVVAVAIARVREALSALHPVTLQQGGLEAALGAVVAQAERRGRLACTLRIEPEAVGQHDELVLSVARELLHNVTKHASASEASVTVDRERGDGGEGVVVEVADDGTGIGEGRREQAIREGHIGLAAVTERVEATGGDFTLSSDSATGTVARAWMPLGG